MNVKKLLTSSSFCDWKPFDKHERCIKKRRNIACNRLQALTGIGFVRIRKLCLFVCLSVWLFVWLFWVSVSLFFNLYLFIFLIFTSLSCYFAYFFSLFFILFCSLFSRFFFLNFFFALRLFRSTGAWFFRKQSSENENKEWT